MKVCIRFPALCHDWFLHVLLVFDWSVILPFTFDERRRNAFVFALQNLIILWFHGLIYV